MLVKHKAQQTCEGAIYHSTKLETIKDVCNIKYYLHLDPKPELLDSGESVVECTTESSELEELEVVVVDSKSRRL